MADPVYVLTINGTVTHPLRLGFDIREVANGRNRITLRLYSPTGAPPVALFDTLALTEDGVLIFGGIVDAPTEAGVGGLPRIDTETTVSAGDYNQLAERRYTNLAFPAGTLKAQLTHLLTVFGEVTLDPAQPDGPSLPAWGAPFWRVDDVLTQLTALSGGYLWTINYARVLSMCLPTTVAAPVAITDSNRVAIGDLTVTPSTENYCNRVLLLYGADGIHQTEDRHTGDGVTATFPVRNFHYTNFSYVVVNGVTEALGWFDDPGIWSLADGAGTITRLAGPPAAGATIVFPYHATFPTLVYADAPGGITTPPGLWEVLLRAPDVYDWAVAQQTAIYEVGLRSARPRTIVYRTHERGLHPGQLQPITKSARHLAAVNCTISEVTIRNTTGGQAERLVTAIEGGGFPGTWRDMIKGWNEAGNAAGNIAPGTTPPSGGGGGGGGGSIGPGTAGVLAKWLTSGTIGDSIVSESGGTVTVAGGVTATLFTGSGAGLTNLNAGALATGTVPVARLPQFLGGDVVTATAGSVNLQLAAGAITNGDISPSAGISWSKIDKTTALLSDLGGTITYPQLPPGVGTWTAQPTITGPLTLSNHLYATTAYSVDVGELSKKYRSIHAAELWVETLVASSTMATIGGRILVAPTTSLAIDVVASDSAIWVKHDNLALGDRIYLESAGRLEWMAVTSAPTPGAYGFLYTVTRNLDGSGAEAWFAGDAVLNTGTTGSGFIDLYSTRGLKASTEVGPTIVGRVRLSSVYYDYSPRWAAGNLRGLYGYGADVYGFAAGDFDGNGPNLTIDATNGLRIRAGAVNKLVADLAGNLNLVGDLVLGPASVVRGVATAFASGPAGYWLDYNSGFPRLRVGDPVGNRLVWDGDNLTMVSATVTINSLGIEIALLTNVSYQAQYGYKFATNYGGVNWCGLFSTHDTSLAVRRLKLYNMTTSATPVETSLVADAGGYFAGLRAYATGTATTYCVVTGSFLTLPAWTSIGPAPPTQPGHPLHVVYAPGDDWLAGFRNQTGVGGYGVYVSGGPTSGGRFTQSWYAGDMSTLVGTASSDGTWSKPISSTWAILSDGRTKRDVTPYIDARARLRDVKIVNYVHNGLFGTRAGAAGVGVVAEDLAAIFPRAVTTQHWPRHPVTADRLPWARKEPVLLVNPHELFMATVAAVIELDAEVRALRAELKGRSDDG